jgi:tetracycline 7-halogenase / FADH2 O2-dependent halogenase
MTPVHDVAILGASIGGATLALILARLGKRVVLIDTGLHPRFAVGEATTPYTTHSLNLIAEEFDIPALAPSRFFRGALRSRCGVKRNFGFVYHRPGEEPNPAEAQLSPVPTESHLFRQDTDAHVMALAASYGVELKQQARLERLTLDTDAVRLGTNQGEVVARYFVDGSGFSSPVDKLLGIEPKGGDLASFSCSLFTHMVGVTPFDDLFAHSLPGRFSRGTLHHVFDGGWLWVIPFNNHPDSTNPLVSVGLQLDPRVVTPPTPAQAESYFRDFLTRYPAMERQFLSARSVRPWIVSNRLQHRAAVAGGFRWCKLPSAYGFIDPLYSKGLSQTFDAVRLIAGAIKRTPDAELGDLVTALDFDAAYESWIRAHDRITAGSYVSFRDPKLWRQFWFAWFSTTVASEFCLMSARVDRRRGNASPVSVTTTNHFPEASKYLVDCFDITSRVEAGNVGVAAATDQLAQQNSRVSWMPPFARRYTESGYTKAPRLTEISETVRWLRGAEPHVQSVYRNLMRPELVPILR